MLDYIRGFFDGDGSVVKKKYSISINLSIICANKDFLEDINNFLEKEYGIVGYVASTKGKYYTIRWRVQESIELGLLFYDNDYLSLPRKKKKFFEALHLRE